MQLLLLSTLLWLTSGHLIEENRIQSRIFGPSHDHFIVELPSTGYHYPIPVPDPPVIPGLYDPPFLQPNISYPPFQQDPVPSPPSDEQDTVVITNPLFPATAYGYPTTSQFKMRIFNMSCMETSGNKFFRTTIKTSYPVSVAPVMDYNAGQECDVLGSGDTFRIDLENGNMERCGVRHCSGADRINLCVSLRMPSLKGLKLPEDSVVTLQCKPQDRVAVHTKFLRIKPQVM